MVFVEVGDHGYGMICDITNTSITGFSTDDDRKTLMIEIRPAASGKFGIELDRAILDSKDEANMSNNEVIFRSSNMNS